MFPSLNYPNVGIIGLRGGKGSPASYANYNVRDEVKFLELHFNTYTQIIQGDRWKTMSGHPGMGQAPQEIIVY
jgi:hypothetical protein